MGCTSSTPNMPEITANASASESENCATNITGDAKEDRDAIHRAVESDLRDEIVSNVLPTCDSLEENIHLARNGDCFTKIYNEEQGQGGLHFSSGKIFYGTKKRDLLPFVIFWMTDNQLNNSILETKQVKISDKESEQKFTTLKDVADQVILNNVFEEIDQTPAPHHEKSNTEVENVAIITEDKPADLLEECSDEKLEDTENQELQEDIEESTSPSQSDGNRSTRWEALADIAAELPPSLAVDPITGQIYSLTK